MSERKSSFSHEDLISCGHGELFGPGNCKLPLPPMLMCDRVTEINDHGGDFEKGYIESEYDIDGTNWFFESHFEGDPVMPGCLMLDALWQLTGFHLGWLGGPGLGRALGMGELKLKGMVLPTNKLVTYKIHMKRVIMRRLVMGVADGVVEVDGELIVLASDLKVGLFKPDESMV